MLSSSDETDLAAAPALISSQQQPLFTSSQSLLLSPDLPLWCLRAAFCSQTSFPSPLSSLIFLLKRKLIGLITFSFSTWMCHISHMKRDRAASSSYFWSVGLVITLESTSEQKNLIKSSVFVIACVHVWAARVRWRNATLICGVAEQKLAANDSRGNLIRGKKKKRDEEKKPVWSH